MNVSTLVNFLHSPKLLFNANVLRFQQPIALLVSTVACVVSVHADTSYTPPPASGGPYPAASSPSPAPYPPSGWKPSGRQFLLPSRQTATASSYLPPKTYGPPKPTTPAVETEATTIEGTTTKPGVRMKVVKFGKRAT